MQNNYDSRGACEGVTYAGFWVRLAAYLIDTVIVFFLLLPVRPAMSGVMSVLSETVLGGNILFSYTLKDIVLYLGEVLYFILCTRYTGTTPGKRAMNLRVVCVDESGELDFFTVVYRETVGRFLCGISVCIGYLIIGLDKEKRGFHDMLCDTCVVYGKKVKIYPVPQQNASYGMHPVPQQNAANGIYPVPQQNAANGIYPAPQQNAANSIYPVPQQNAVNNIYPAPQHNGPYHMVHPDEQNVRPEIKEEKGDSSEL